MRSTPTTPIEAAGGLVWRVRGGHLQVILVHRPRYGDWSWPKGKLEPGEGPVEAAVREVAEETGLAVVLGIPLPDLTYRIEGGTKHVRYWAARVAGRDDRPALAARPKVPRAARAEIDRTKWLDVAEASQRLTSASDRGPLQALVAAHDAGHLATRSLVIARHARARKRDHWPGDELDRPLTRIGRAQAATLPPLLSAFGVTRIVTSPWARCAMTIAPYAKAAGITPQAGDPLTEHAHELSPAQVARTVAQLLTAPGSAALCTHRPVLPTVLDVLAEHSGREVADTLPSTEPFLRPSQLLVAQVVDTPVGPRCVAVQRVGPAR